MVRAHATLAARSLPRGSCGEKRLSHLALARGNKDLSPLPSSLPCLACRAQSLTKGSKLLNFINARMRVTISASRVLVGTFLAFDKHMNLVLGDCEETHTTEEVDSETGETIVKRNVRQLGMLFVRGDIIVHVSPPLRAA